MDFCSTSKVRKYLKDGDNRCQLHLLFVVTLVHQAVGSTLHAAELHLRTARRTALPRRNAPNCGRWDSLDASATDCVCICQQVVDGQSNQLQVLSCRGPDLGWQPPPQACVPLPPSSNSTRRFSTSAGPVNYPATQKQRFYVVGGY